MAHPTKKFFCFKENNEYKMLRCYWYKHPRPADLEGPQHYYDEPNQITIRWFLDANPTLDVHRDFDKVVLECWTAPDCIFDKIQLGQWSNYGTIILEEVQYLTSNMNSEESYLEVSYTFKNLSHTTETETIYLSTDNLHPDRPLMFGHRPVITAQDIIDHRNEPRGSYI